MHHHLWENITQNISIVMSLVFAVVNPADYHIKSDLFRVALILTPVKKNIAWMIFSKKYNLDLTLP